MCDEDDIPGDAFERLECGHALHDRCLQRWKQTHPDESCPLCRGDIAEGEELHGSDAEISADDNEEPLIGNE